MTENIESNSKPTTKLGFLGIWEHTRFPQEVVDQRRERIVSTLDVLRPRSYMARLHFQDPPLFSLDRAKKQDYDEAERNLRKIDQKPERWYLSRVLWIRRRQPEFRP